MSSSELVLSPKQYRALAKVTKSFGTALSISPFSQMGCFGSYSPWALDICKNARVPNSYWDERGTIHLSSKIDPDQFRSAGENRPEVDWSVLEDSEIYPFITWHEIGHRMDNFCSVSVLTITDLDVRDKCNLYLRYVNEVLADRYAWARIRPGDPVPVNEFGKQNEERFADQYAFLKAHCPHTSRYTRSPLSQDPYRDVPGEMLATYERAAFLGSKVDGDLLRRCVEKHKQRESKASKSLYA